MWKFTPIYKETIWGGTRIASLKGIPSPSPRIGETWELSAYPMWETRVSEGPDTGKTLRDLCREYGSSFLGKHNFERFGEEFPLLVKFIDATSDLSVQVHPDDIMARRLGYPNGKSEMWYVVGSESGARIANGFRFPVDPVRFESLAESGEISESLNFVEVAPGEVYYVPAGSVHALGAGTMVVEIQQTSDTTYRIYDYGRIDDSGNPRELHSRMAREVIDFTPREGGRIPYSMLDGVPSPVISTPYFDVHLLGSTVPVERDYGELDSFGVLIGLEGECRVISGSESTGLRCGETLLIPASAGKVRFIPRGNFKVLEASICS